MYLRIDPKIFNQYPDFKLGVIILRGIDNGKRISTIESLLRGICAQREKQFKDKELYEEPMIKAWYDTYGNLGVNPKKYPPSIAALLKRVASGKELPHINALVDLYNYFSLKHLLPIGGEDLDWLCGDLQLTFTQGGEPFRPIGSIEVETAKEGEAAYIDTGGITCRYWNYRECERTKFTKKTVNAAILIEDMSKMPIDKFSDVVREVQNGFIKYIGGQIEPYILDEENPVVDLRVEGRKNIDDSKIPQQEKVHFLEESKKKTLTDEPKVMEETSAPDKNSSNKSPSSNSEVSNKENIISLPENLFPKKLQKLLEKALEKAFEITDKEIKIEYPNDETHGDYASNVALQITKELQKPPREIAQAIIDNLEDNTLIKKVEIAGPGFINFFISDQAYQEELAQVLQNKDQYGANLHTEGETIAFEYSSPNIAKPLGIHHLLSTVIGQSLHDIFKFIGFKAISVNHIGDWGTQFGKLIYAYKRWGSKEAIEKDPINELLKLYIKFHDEAEKDPVLEDAGRHEFNIFEKGDPENRELWQWFVDESMKEINKTYKKLGGIHFEYTHGESFYEDKMQEIIDYGKENKIFVEGKEGAYVVKYDNPDVPPFVILKKDGATLYSTRDFAALHYRIKSWQPKKILYVVDIAQTLHFKQLFEAAKRFPWYHGEGEHVWFGRMHMKDGKMSTRKGNVILLDDVLEEAVSRAKNIIEEKSPTLEDKENVARVVGIGAVKYNVLSQNRTTDITFDWDKMLSFEGNSAPYLQYTYARARSILRKADQSEQDTDSSNTETADNLSDIATKTHALIRLFPRFSDQLIQAAEDYKPNVLSNYLYELAQKFNSFYNSVPVLRTKNAEEQKQRLQIVDAASQILKNGLALLGVEVIEEM